MGHAKRTVHIKVERTKDGRFRAYCPEIEALSAEAETGKAAAQVLKDLIETHTENVRVVIVAT
jgi:predicted RNase H-like HicB family nuclease